MRIMCFDYGSKTVGVAVTDELMITAQPVETIFRDSENRLRKTLARIEALIEEYGAEELVVGYPLNMDGTEGESAKKAAEFAGKLEMRTNLPVVMHDERLSSEFADEILEEMGVKRDERKRYIDKIAAACILEDYLNERK